MILTDRNHLVAADASQALSDSLAWDTVPRIVLEVRIHNPTPFDLEKDG